MNDLTYFLHRWANRGGLCQEQVFSGIIFFLNFSDLLNDVGIIWRSNLATVPLFSLIVIPKVDFYFGFYVGREPEVVVTSSHA